MAGLGITVAALEAEGRVRAGTAIEINQDIYEVVMALRGGGSSQVDWVLDDAANALEGLSGEFDLIVGSPPINLPNATLDLKQPAPRLVASKTYTMLVQAARLLAPDGTLAVVLPMERSGGVTTGQRRRTAGPEPRS